MRPIKLTMTAFGPYKGSEVVDFRELKDMNLFLITGPTGAGKTTIFDAISFAIYGEASGNMRSADSLRSHFSDDEVLTEVALEFELKGIRYHIHRIPKQNKPKARGEGTTEQKPEATLTIFAEGGNVVVAGVKSVNDKIEAILGINAEQFKQIMMIPQGEFQKLLTAGSEDRQRVLQQLFDTSIYNTLQMRLDVQAKNLDTLIKKNRDMRDDRISRIECPDEGPLKELILAEDKSVAEIVLMTQEQIEMDRQLTSQLDTSIREMDQQIEQTIEAREKSRESNENLKRKVAIQAELLEMEQLSGEMTTLDQQVKQAELALLMVPFEENHRLRIRDYESKKTELAEVHSKIEGAQIRAKAAEADYLKESTPEKVKQREVFIEELTRLRSYEDKVQKIESVRASIAETEGVCKQLELDRQANVHSIEVANKALTELREQAVSAKNAEVSAAVKKEQLAKMTDEGKRIKKLLDIQLDIITTKSGIQVQQKKVDQLAEKVQASLMQHKTSKLDWLMNQAAVLAKDLNAGEACPVCGSTHHPTLAVFSEHAVTEEQLNRLESVVKQCEEDFNRENRTLGIHENQLVTFIANRAEVTQDLSETMEVPLAEQPDDDYKAFLENLIESKRAEVREISKSIQALEQLANTHQTLVKDIERIVEDVQKADRQTVELTALYLEKTNKLSVEKAALQHIFDEVPEAIRQAGKLAEAIASQEKLQREAAETLNRSLKAYEESRDLHLRHKAYGDQLAKDLAVANENLQQAQSALELQIAQSSFANMEAYQKAKLTQETMAQYRNRIEQHAKTCHALKEQLEVLVQRTKDHEPVELAVFEEQIQKLRLENESWTQRKNGTQNRVDHNLRMIKEVDAIQRDMGDKETLYKVVGNLANVAKGNNPARITFERYVLAAFLEDIITAANIRLNQMTSGRYRLSRTEELQRSNAKGGLELEVYDNYTGKSRHVRTLSGGEGFKASLAMALGLADVVQAYAGGVQLDTMFIDEGFGTLDQESLDSAISCLIDLQKTGRLVGIISHVQELKERMDARLEVHSTNLGSETRFVVG